MPDELFCDLYEIVLPANDLVIGLLLIFLLTRPLPFIAWQRTKRAYFIVRRIVD